MMRKRVIALALALTLALGLMSGISFAQEEKRVLTVGAMGDFAQEIDVWTPIQRIKDELNIEIQHTYYSGDSFTTMLASNDLPDLVYSKKNLAVILSNNLAMDMRPYIEEYAPNMLGYAYKDTVDLLCNLLGGENNAMYIFCPLVGMSYYDGGSNFQKRGYVVRWDYYKELGCPPISNDDEYIDLLLQMYEKHPTAEDGSPAFLMGAETGLMDLGGYRAAWRSDIAVNTWCFYLYKADNYNNELTNGYTDLERSSYWADMKFFNKVYRAGNGEFGFDLDCFTMTYDEFAAKIANGQYMGQEFLRNELYEAAVENDPDTDKAYQTIPSAGMTVYANCYMPLGNAPSNFWFISEGSQNYDIALQFMNYLCDPEFLRYAYCGEQGIDWDYDEEGVPYFTEKALAEMNDPECTYWAADGEGFGNEGNIYGLRGTTICADGYPANLRNLPEVRNQTQSGNKLMQDWCETFGVDYYYQAFENTGVRDYRNDQGENITAVLSSDVPKDILRIIEACNDVMTSAMPELVMAETDEEFAAIRDDVLRQLETLNEATAWEWMKANWETPKEYFNAALVDVLDVYGLEPYPVSEN